MSEKNVLADCFVLDKNVVFTITKLEEHFISFNIHIVYCGDHVLFLPLMIVHPLHLVPVVQCWLLQVTSVHPVRKEKKKYEVKHETLKHNVGAHLENRTAMP